VGSVSEGFGEEGMERWRGDGRRSSLRWPIARNSTCRGLGCLDDRLRAVKLNDVNGEWGRTDSGRHNYVAVLSFAHDGEHGFDDVDVGEEVGLECVLHECDGPTALRQLFDSTDDGFARAPE
jgi:hypothetical protein